MSGTRILFQGDSITDGNRYKLKEQEWDKNHQMGHSFAYIINGALGSRYPEKNLEFINRGISGNRIIDLYARVNKDIIDIRPDILSILVGINDIPTEVNGITGTAPAKFERLYRMMLDEVLTALPDLKLVFCEPIIFPVRMEVRDYPACLKSVQSFQAITAKLAEDYHGIFVPLQEEFNRLFEIQKPEYWCWDGIHPTENGHGVIAGQWIKATEGIL